MMRGMAIFLLVLCASSWCALADATISKVIRWDNRIEDGTAYALAPTRGETMVLQPRFLQYGVPMDLSHAYTVYLIYRAVNDTNAYSVSGTILNATNGQAQIEFGPSNELAATTYAYDILVSSASSTVVGARGAIKYRDGVASGATLADLQPINILDFDQVLLLNVGNAPFLSSYEIADVREYLTAIQSGIGDIDADDVTIRGTLTYTNWPGYLARTSDIPERVTVAAGANITVATTTNAGRIIYTVTGAAGGGTGGGGIGSYTNTSINGVTHSNSVYIADGDNITWALGTDGVWRASAIIPDGSTSTGTIYWIVNGETIGRVDSNGITMLQGSLTLQEEDLTCNVRMYDGSRQSPSLTPAGHPGTWGLYFRGFSGSYSAAWSQGSNEVGILSGSGIQLQTTNAAFTGRHIGDASGLTNYPEPLFLAFSTNGLYPEISITNSGSLKIKGPPWGYDAIVLSGSNRTVKISDIGQTVRVNIDGENGVITIKDASNWTKFTVDSQYSYFTGSRTQYTRNAGNTAAVTNIINYQSGLVTSFVQTP